MPRVPHSCRHYRRESLVKYPGSPFGKHSHRALIRQVLREMPKARLQNMMYPKPFAFRNIYHDYPSWNAIISLDKDLTVDVPSGTERK